MTFEEALQELEKIVVKLESGSITLEEALELYMQGVKALSTCEQQLTQAEQKVEILLRDMRKPFKPEVTYENI